MGVERASGSDGINGFGKMGISVFHQFIKSNPTELPESKLVPSASGGKHKSAYHLKRGWVGSQSGL